MSAGGLSTTDLEDTARIARLECAIQTAISAANCMQVSVTGVNAARRTGVTITYEVLCNLHHLRTAAACVGVL